MNERFMISPPDPSCWCQPGHNYEKASPDFDDWNFWAVQEPRIDILSHYIVRFFRS